ncbi:aminotransferase class I/II-fold pyridoxal phosphate-dependent enzyme [Bacillus mangrovi]|uniref:Aminotransferase class I/II-fold pyridoxal phosphate-dependent enzyme n=2 Tax=Metabacillus mangrovi TaxID=1491830 RepID=A0A7X2S7X0_9BACI|nr:aminotransferase class I/II-fold pyridoxal phosphate-dependent enzyme [Metabacillus mangrovi]
MYTPLFSALVKHYEKGPVSFHVPGHKYGQLFPEQAAPYYKELLKLDATELTGLDDLHDPQGIIFEAEQLAASHYGAEKTFFLVNGSTAGNLAMIMACCSEGDTVLVQRNSHKSIMNALELVKADPVFLSPKLDEALQVPSYIEEEQIKAALNDFPEAKALILTNPNYYGVTADLTNVIRAAHSCHIPVLVDEAHGAHFGIGAPFPESALAAGADAVVQSAHKTLPAMTMGSYLHVNSGLVSIKKTARMLAMLQSSSPSYPIMASLDLARAFIQDIKESGRAEEAAQNAEKWHEYFNSAEGIQSVRTKDAKAMHDPLKLSIQSESGLSGYRLQKIFERCGLYGELADDRSLLLVAGIGNQELPAASLEKELASAGTAGRRPEAVFFPSLPPARLALSYREREELETESLPLEQAAGRVMAEPIIPYPPGIPVVLAGEELTSLHLQWILQMKEQGARFQGHHNVNNVLVYKRG